MSSATYWDSLASSYDQTRTGDGIYMAAVDATVRALGAQPGEHILDAGCGTGIPMQRYFREGLEVTAIDSSQASLDLIRQKLGSEQIHLKVGSITQLPAPDAAFDRSLCANTLQHLDSANARRKCLSELARCTKTNGKVVVSVHQWSLRKQRANWSKEGDPGGVGQPDYIYRFEPTEFRELLEHSLEDVQIFGAGFTFPRGGLWRLERLLQAVPLLTNRAHMLIGVGYSKRRS